jgi:hypothetical protein
VLAGHVADPDSCDQAFVSRGYQGAELVHKPFVRRGVVHHAQVYSRELRFTVAKVRATA